MVPRQGKEQYYNGDHRQNLGFYGLSCKAFTVCRARGILGHVGFIAKGSLSFSLPLSLSIYIYIYIIHGQPYHGGAGTQDA